MTIGRLCALVSAFAMIALAVVHLRGEQTRCAARAMSIQAESVEQRRELWRLQSSVARLQAPLRLHNCMGQFHVDLVPPRTGDWWASGTRMATTRPND